MRTLVFNSQNGTRDHPSPHNKFTPRMSRQQQDPMVCYASVDQSDHGALLEQLSRFLDREIQTDFSDTFLE